jgi:hypothetical protein
MPPWFGLRSANVHRREWWSRPSFLKMSERMGTTSGLSLLSNIYHVLSILIGSFWYVSKLHYWGKLWFTRWIDPAPIYPHQQYINYLQERIFDLERKVGSGTRDEEDENNNNDVENLCTDPYCQCPYHKKKGPPPPSPPPPPPSMGEYCREGSTQFAMWEHY